MKVLVSGSSGLIGSALLESLMADGHAVERLPRTFEETIDFTGVDAVVHLAGESIAEGRWSAEKKQRIEASRVKATWQLAKQISASESKPAVFVCASAVGIYGDRAAETLNESSAPGTGFLAEVCKKWEAAAQPVAEAGVRTVALRTGVVLSQKGGALQKMLPAFRSGAGGIIGRGRQYMSWISLEDEVRAIRFAIKNESIKGALNLTAPHPVSNLEFTKTLGQVLHRTTLLPLPAFAVRLLFGEMGEELLLASARVLPEKLIEAGFEFCHPHLQNALEEILK